MDQDPLDTLLDRWRPPPEPPPNLRREVWRRLARLNEKEEAPTWMERWETLFLRPAFVLSCVAICLIAAFFIADLRTARDSQHHATGTDFAYSYRRMIDPMQSDSPRIADRASDPEQLDWLKSELRLTDEQYAQIKLIHERSNPHLVALAGQVAQLRAELAAFEKERRTEGRIDFLEFARWVDTRRSVDRECAASTRRLVLATASVMNETQRTRYLGLLGPALADNNTLH